MSSTISATSTAPTADALFTKLDTKKKGYLDAADLKAAAGATDADDAKAAEAFKQIDSDSDGKITKSELSAAIDKVGDQLDAQLDASRIASGGGARPAGGHGGGGAPPVASAGGSDTETAAKYVAAADTDSDGTVTAAEAAAYKKLQEASAEAKALAQVQEYKDNSGTSAAPASGTIDVSA